ncbi:Canalicular multispecific organic anion transporter 1, partial [Coemansia sp. RSA 1694]
VAKKIDRLRKQSKMSKPPKFQEQFYTLLGAIRTIKFYAWEDVFRNVLWPSEDLKAYEPPLVWRVLQFGLDLLGSATAEISAAVTITSYISTAGEIDYIDVALLMESIRQMQRYIDPESNKYIERSLAVEDSVAVNLSECVFSWSADGYSLAPISLQIKAGEFVTVVGRVGSGKSSFLSAICGEMPLTSGQGCVYGRIGYVEQKPWIMNATFRDNVLMGADFDQTCFWQVVEACALAVDVQLFPKSDMTMIGTDGVNLSGGQKVRLALARYTDTYVFDDLLSAVDAHVERHIVEHVLSASGIIGQKTRILVTHAEHLVPLSDAVITFTDGNLSIVRQTPLAYNAVPSETADSKESTPNSDSGTTEQQVGAADMYEKPPEYRRISSMWSAIWHFVKFSEYGTVAIVMATQVTQTYALYYTQSLRTELMTDGNPASMAQSLKHYLVVNALAEIGSHQVRKFEKWIQETVWTASLMAKMRSQIVDLVLSMPLSVLESLPDSAMEDLFYQCRWTLAKNMPEFLCHSVLFGILSALSATAQVIKTSPGLILLCGPL